MYFKVSLFNLKAILIRNQRSLLSKKKIKKCLKPDSVCADRQHARNSAQYENMKLRRLTVRAIKEGGKVIYNLPNLYQRQVFSKSKEYLETQ